MGGVGWWTIHESRQIRIASIASRRGIDALTTRQITRIAGTTAWIVSWLDVERERERKKQLRNWKESGLREGHLDRRLE